MEIYKNNAELKRLARMQMNGKWGVLIGAMVLSRLLTYAVVYIVSGIIPTTSPAMYALNYVVTFMVQLLSFVLTTGMCMLHLHAACNMECRLSDMFYAFKNNPDKSIKIGAILAVINSICMIPSDIMMPDLSSILYSEITTTEQLLATYNVLMSFYMVIILCELLYFVLALPFVPAFYMILDFPDATVRTILSKSIEIMRGNKLRYAVLCISFIPLILLSFFTCGIALLWIMPYISMTETNFYLDLISTKKISLQKDASHF